MRGSGLAWRRVPDSPLFSGMVRSPFRWGSTFARITVDSFGRGLVVGGANLWSGVAPFPCLHVVSSFANASSFLPASRDRALWKWTIDRILKAAACMSMCWLNGSFL